MCLRTMYPLLIGTQLLKALGVLVRMALWPADNTFVSKVPVSVRFLLKLKDYLLICRIVSDLYRVCMRITFSHI